MKKVAVAVLVVALLTVMFAVPVMAAPPEDKKVPVTLQWTRTSSTLIERRDVDHGQSLRIYDQVWAAKLYIDGSTTPLEGTADVTRWTLYRYSKAVTGLDQVVNDDYVLEFASEGGGFVGNVHILLTDYVSITDFGGMVHALLQGTGSFEGQTLNVGVKMTSTAADMLWEGYLSKPEN
jgi:hypothetical protein